MPPRRTTRRAASRETDDDEISLAAPRSTRRATIGGARGPAPASRTRAGRGVSMSAAGEEEEVRTVIPKRARPSISPRLSPGQPYTLAARRRAPGLRASIASSQVPLSALIKRASALRTIAEEVLSAYVDAAEAVPPDEIQRRWETLETLKRNQFTSDLFLSARDLPLRPNTPADPTIISACRLSNLATFANILFSAVTPSQAQLKDAWRAFLPDVVPAESPLSHGVLRMFADFSTQVYILTLSASRNAHLADASAPVLHHPHIDTLNELFSPSFVVRLGKTDRRQSGGSAQRRWEEIAADRRAEIQETPEGELERLWPYETFLSEMLNYLTNSWRVGIPTPVDATPLTPIFLSHQPAQAGEPQQRSASLSPSPSSSAIADDAPEHSPEAEADENDNMNPAPYALRPPPQLPHAEEDSSMDDEDAIARQLVTDDREEDGRGEMDLELRALEEMGDVSEEEEEDELEDEGEAEGEVEEEGEGEEVVLPSVDPELAALAEYREEEADQDCEWEDSEEDMLAGPPRIERAHAAEKARNVGCEGAAFGEHEGGDAEGGEDENAAFHNPPRVERPHAAEKHQPLPAHEPDPKLEPAPRVEAAHAAEKHDVPPPPTPQREPAPGPEEVPTPSPRRSGPSAPLRSERQRVSCSVDRESEAGGASTSTSFKIDSAAKRRALLRLAKLTPKPEPTPAPAGPRASAPVPAAVPQPTPPARPPRQTLPPGTVIRAQGFEAVVSPNRPIVEEEASENVPQKRLKLADGKMFWTNRTERGFRWNAPQDDAVRLSESQFDSQASPSQAAPVPPAGPSPTRPRRTRSTSRQRAQPPAARSPAPPRRTRSQCRQAACSPPPTRRVTRASSLQHSSSAEPSEPAPPKRDKGKSRAREPVIPELEEEPEPEHSRTEKWVRKTSKTPVKNAQAPPPPLSEDDWPQGMGGEDYPEEPFDGLDLTGLMDDGPNTFEDDETHGRGRSISRGRDAPRNPRGQGKERARASPARSPSLGRAQDAGRRPSPGSSRRSPSLGEEPDVEAPHLPQSSSRSVWRDYPSTAEVQGMQYRPPMQDRSAPSSASKRKRRTRDSGDEEPQRPQRPPHHAEQRERGEEEVVEEEEEEDELDEVDELGSERDEHEDSAYGDDRYDRKFARRRGRSVAERALGPARAPTVPREREATGKKRRVRVEWTDKEDRCLLDAVKTLWSENHHKLPYKAWVLINGLHGPAGSKSKILAQRDNTDLRGRASRLLDTMIKAGQKLHPAYKDLKPDAKFKTVQKADEVGDSESE